jgi:hypothetical protein
LGLAYDVCTQQVDNNKPRGEREGEQIKRICTTTFN